MDGIDAWELQRLRDIESSRAAFEARPDYAELIEQAAQRGFRRISLWEQMEPGKVDAYQWRGGVWVKDS
jgi:hypothetical protein